MPSYARRVCKQQAATASMTSAYWEVLRICRKISKKRFLLLRGDLGIAPTKQNDNFPYETLSDFRMAPIAPFSSRDTWAWEMPSRQATSIWVWPS